MDQKVVKCNINSVDQQKDLSDQSQYSKAHIHNKQRAPIFKLNVDCLNKIFDYLSLRDVHSIGETCKPIQQAAGEYFQANYITAAYVRYKRLINSAFIPFDGFFNKFVQNIHFECVPTRLKKTTLYIGKNYNQKFKQMVFFDVDLTAVEIKNLSDKFENVETVILEKCTVNRKFYKQFPKICKNLRRLYVEDFDCRRDVVRRTGNKWLLYTYPKLEHLHWIQSKGWRPINELKLFFQRNPQLRSFTTDTNTLWSNRDLFSESKISLDDLTIELGQDDDNDAQELQNFEYIHAYLKELHEKGVYKRLHFNLKRFSQQTFDEMPRLDALRGLCLWFDDISQGDIILPKWANLFKLKFLHFDLKNLDLLAQQLVNLQQIYFYSISMRDLMHFARHSVHLTKVKIKDSFDYDDHGKCLDVAALNKEREKLKGAKRMVIYIPEYEYLRTKWSLNGMEYSLIEVRRVSSDEWGHQFYRSWI